jgi:hypothetical protein
MWIGLVVIAAAALIARLFTIQVNGGELDFLAYWSAVRLLVTGGNPYDPVALRSLEHEIRPERAQNHGESFASWNPPWLLVVLLPLGLLSFNVATHVWMLCNIGLVGAASALTWRLLGGTPERREVWVALAVVSLWSGPSLVTILAGQSSSLVLIGLVLCAWFLYTGRDGLAGAAMLLAAIKPHVVYLVLLVFVLWVIQHRRWQVLGGMIAAVLMAMAILWVIFPGWVQAYWRLIHAYRSLFFLYPTPTIGSVAYALWGTNLFRFAGILLLPFAPSVARLADRQGWLTAMNVALLISVPLAAYGFSADQVLLLPATLQMVSWLWRGELPKRWAGVIGGGLLLVYALWIPLLIQSRRADWLVWAPLALAGLYALGWRQRSAMSRGWASAQAVKGL